MRKLGRRVGGDIDEGRRENFDWKKEIRKKRKEKKRVVYSSDILKVVMGIIEGREKVRLLTGSNSII